MLKWIDTHCVNERLLWLKLRFASMLFNESDFVSKHEISKSWRISVLCMCPLRMGCCCFDAVASRYTRFCCLFWMSECQSVDNRLFFVAQRVRRAKVWERDHSENGGGLWMNINVECFPEFSEFAFSERKQHTHTRTPIHPSIQKSWWHIFFLSFSTQR